MSPPNQPEKSACFLPVFEKNRGIRRRSQVKTVRVSIPILNAHGDRLPCV
jgi:hypothetical protein